MGTLLITNGTIIDGTGADPIPQGTVVIEDGRITAVEARGRTGDGTAQVIDASGKTVLPGLINLHDHAYRKRLRYPAAGSYREQSKNLVAEPATYLAVLSASNALNELKMGITTTREVGAGYDVSFTLRRAMNEGLLPGPRVLVAGQPLVITGGHEYKMGRECDGPDEVRKAAREQLRAGADLLKFMATGGLARIPEEHPDTVEFTEAELRAGIEEAHKHRKKTCAHAYATEGIKNAVRAGIDSIEHGVFLDEETVALMREHGTDLVPTMSGLYRVAEYYREAGNQEYCELIYDIALRPQQRSFKLAVESGIRWGVGTDSAGEMVEEMELMQAAAGVSAMDCIVGATGRAAQILGMEEQFGTLAPGLAAEVIVVDGDPLAEVTALRRISSVIRAGRLVVQDGHLFA
jgi:imidazolonepropionase-like amidohydrolase